MFCGRVAPVVAAAAITGCVAVAAASAQSITTGFLDRSVTVDGREHRYQTYVPREYQPGARWPVILALHGGGEYGDDGLRQTDGGLARAIRRNSDRFPAIVVFPQSPRGGTPGFQALGERIALAALDKAIAEFNGDRERVYLTGLSMGGNGAWYLAYNHPDRFAAVVPVCAFVGAFTGTTSGVKYPPIVAGPEADAFAAIAKRIARLPVWIFHGDADPTVPVEDSRRMAAALKAAGANVRYTELPGVGHNAWDPAYERADLIAWLFQQRRTSMKGAERASDPVQRHGLRRPAPTVPGAPRLPGAIAGPG
jgi:predicted peptidase